jgi:hypothetical protein
LAVSGQTPDDLFTKLYRQENFRGYAFDARHDSSDEQSSLTSSSSEQADAASQASPSRRFRLQTRLPSDKLQKRLAKIFREERTLEEEQGLSSLYLALGFLKWLDREQSDESFAPLLRVQVTMVREDGVDGNLLRGRDDDIIANNSLREKLKSKRSPQGNWPQW